MTPSGARLIVTSVAACCAFIVLTLPRATAPRPPLLLPTDAERELPDTLATEARQADEAAALAGPAFERLSRLEAEQGRSEVGPGEPPGVAGERALGLQRLLTVLEREHPGATVALRAHSMTRLWPALRGDLDPAEEQEVLGSFPRMLERYGAARDGRRLAPRSVVHAMYKARWNVLHGLPQDAGFSPAEERAFWGWAAAHVESASADGMDPLRFEAIRRYAAAEGPAARELLAFGAYEAREYAHAARLYQDLFEETGHLRYRNHARASLLLAQ
ncbi:MAG: hypothetical protein R3B40_16960 [Polyangiales bacterium]|nr:hypothetical protein [Myxococcales bacterium]MCB9659722.1 hypothetical protein [Sandaracinaceae bacterium]